MKNSIPNGFSKVTCYGCNGHKNFPSGGFAGGTCNICGGVGFKLQDNRINGGKHKAFFPYDTTYKKISIKCNKCNKEIIIYKDSVKRYLNKMEFKIEQQATRQTADNKITNYELIKNHYAKLRYRCPYCEEMGESTSPCIINDFYKQ